jgi:YrbI family 3-deoxy-D-manno-octulosonate 8-phosphate phosphatase
MRKNKNYYIKNKHFSVDIVRNIKMVVFDFDGVFTDNRVLVFDNGREGVLCFRGDGIGISSLKKVGIKTLVISTEINPVVGFRCRKLNIPYVQAVEDKLSILKKETKKQGIAFAQIAYLGNDVNDIDCLKKVGLAVCVADAHPKVHKVCHYITELPGGYGAVREFCDFLMGRKNG